MTFIPHNFPSFPFRVDNVRGRRRCVERYSDYQVPNFRFCYSGF